MKAVRKNFSRIPSGLLTNNLNVVIDISVANHRDFISDNIYRDPTVVKKLKALYNEKCAYCESFEPEPEVEHYRPKKRVTGVTGSIGYYWLCYEWSNLLPACHDCNKQRSKGNHFPIEGIRQITPTLSAGIIDLNENSLTSNSLLIGEIPLLLNPEHPNFDPFNYFFINPKGKICPKPINTTLQYRQAVVTIDKMRLNRDKLELNIRKRHIRYYIKRVKIILYQYLNGKTTTASFEENFKEILIEINQRTRPTRTNEHWFFWEYLFLNFKEYINAFFKPRFRSGLFRLYDLTFSTIRP